MDIQTSMSFRMVQMQIMNIVNVGLENKLEMRNIELLADAMINATQLFLNEMEIRILRMQLNKRLEAQKIII